MADEPTTTTAVPTTSSDASTNTAPLTLDQDQINALTEQANGADNDKSVFEKASDFVTDNAPWFIIGIIVLAAIIAGILIMRGRPRKGSYAGHAEGLEVEQGDAQCRRAFACRGCVFTGPDPKPLRASPSQAGGDPAFPRRGKGPPQGRHRKPQGGPSR